jgi:hypothetical protein
VTIDPEVVTVPPDSTGSGDVYNRFRAGRLEVTKHVDWAGVTPDTEQTFEICVTGPSYPGGDCQDADYDGGTLVWDPVIPGDYTVSEADPGAVWDVTIDPVVVTVPPDGTGSGDVYNDYQPGSLKITKVVDWSGLTPVAGQQFEICIQGPSYPDGDCKLFTYPDDLVKTWYDLIPGEYRIGETDPEPFWDVTISPNPVTVEPNAAASATVTNKRVYVGYTPGFWKNHWGNPAVGHDHNAWDFLPTYTTDHLVGDVFSGDILNKVPKKSDKPMGEHTLLEALSFKGGPGPKGAAEILLRAGVAALLNADLTDWLMDSGQLGGFLPYPYDIGQVVAMVNAALQSGDAATMLEVATDLDDTNNGGGEYFDWEWETP